MLQKIVGVKLSEQVVEQIKNMIIQGVYQKGTMLPSEKDLILLTGVSRITVREALKSLAEVGIIETRQGKGSIIIIDPSELGYNSENDESREQYTENFLKSNQARLLIEPEIAARAATMATDEDIESLQIFLRKNKTSENESLFDNFHYEIVKIADNPYMTTFFEHLLKCEVSNKPDICLIPPQNQKKVSEELRNQHIKIFEAIKSHNQEFAYFYMKDHMTYVLKTYKDFFDQFLI